jgi:hypothetical protein
MGPTDYKPRRNNYQPLKELDPKNAREAPEKEVTGQQVKHGVEQQREEEPQRPPLSRILERMPGGPDSGDRATNETWAIAQNRANNEALQARQSKEIDQNRDEAAAPRQRTPIKDLVKQSAELSQEIQDPSIDRKGPDVDR